MRTLILTTVSAVALGIAGFAPSYAAQNTAATPGSTVTQPVATPGATTPQPAATGATQSSMPQAGAAATQPLGSSSQYNKPYMANSSPSGTAAARVTRSEVRQVEQKLRGEGLYHGRIDGLMGPETSQALRRYQQKNGLPATARLDQDTLNRLLGADGGQGSSAPGALTPSSGAGTAGSGASNWTNTSPANRAK